MCEYQRTTPRMTVRTTPTRIRMMVVDAVRSGLFLFASSVKTNTAMAWRLSFCLLTYFAPLGLRSIAISLSVCASVCLFICLSGRITRKTCSRTSPIFLCMLPMAAAQSACDGVVICYVLPVLRMASGFHFHWTYRRTEGHGVVY